MNARHFRTTRPCWFPFATLLPGLLAPGFLLSSPLLSEENPVPSFVRNHCAECHGLEKQKGELDLVSATSSDHEVWINVLEQLESGEMPPEDEPRPAEEKVAEVTAWIRSSLQNADEPGFGNYVSHTELFDEPPRGKPSSPPRYWRIRPASYHRMLARISREDYNDPFSLDGDHGFRDFASRYQLETPDLELLLGNAQVAANRLTQFKIEEGKIRRQGWDTPNEFLAILDPAAEPTEKQWREAIHWQYHRTLQREPSPEEETRMLEFVGRTEKQSDRTQALKNLVCAVLLLPEALYRFERGTGAPDEFGRIRLGQRELAYALSYALSDQAPDGGLLQSPLDSTAEIEAQVDRFFESEKISTPRILEFFREYFGYVRAPDVFKDPELFDQHLPDQLVADTDALVLHLFNRDRDVLKELLTTNLSFVNYTWDPNKKVAKRNPNRRVHESYNLPPDWKWTPDQPIQLPGSQRAGILTQPSWLVANSDNFNNHAILRGKWIREQLLGGTIPNLPISVDAQLPNDETLTLRQKMEVTEKAYCWRCHERMNPLGLTFEQYDHFGRWRLSELDEPVVTAGKIHLGPDPGIEREYGDPVSLVHALADSPRVRQVFVRHVFRFFLGRNETLLDAATLQEADRAYLESGGSMKTLIKSLLCSDSFLYRKVELSR